MLRLVAVSSCLFVLAACGAKSSSSNKASPSGGNTPGGGTPSDVPPGTDPSSVSPDGGADEGGATEGPPAIAYVGRFDDGDPGGRRFAWPGTKVVARFDGTEAIATLTQTDASSGGPSWFNVIVDGAVQAPVSVTQGTHPVTVATGLSPGVHVVELEKRTEPNLGMVRFDGFAFNGGKGLLAPPARATRRIEVLSDSTIDGFGVEGDVATTCGGAAPGQFHNVRKSTAAYAAKALGAEASIVAYSGKGIQVNTYAPDPDVFDVLYPRALPEQATPWDFNAWTADVVVVSLGGVDFDAQTTIPNGFVTRYGQLVDAIRGHYPSAHVYITVWAQIKDASRVAMQSALDQVAAARASDTKLHVFVFPQATSEDETGCYAHANDAEHQKMGAALAQRIKADLAW